MIIPKKSHFTDEQLEEIRQITREFGVDVEAIAGTHMTIYAIKGDEREEVMMKRLEGLEYVDRIDRIQHAYKLMARDSELARSKVNVRGRELGQELYVIAGHCTVDPNNPNQFIETAHAVKEAGANAIRGGVWKPRTSPHSYQGTIKALDILKRAAEETGMPVNTEVMDADQLDSALEAGADILQVGARNALNYYLLKTIGRRTKKTGTMILLKRSMHMGPIDEFILAAEYIVSSGNPNVALCPRGTVPKMDGYRNHPDESITPLLKERTWAPVVVDPSHSVGKAIYVPHAALAAVAYGADGLNIECNIDPVRGIGDDPKQAITPKVLGHLIADAREVFTRRTRYQTYLQG